MPANFYFLKDIPESYELPLLELKEEYIIPIKQTPLLSKLKNRGYQTDKSKSNYKIVKEMTFFFNNLPSLYIYINR